MDKLKEIIGISYYLLGFLEAKHQNSDKEGYINFIETTEYKSLTSIIDYLNNLLKSE